MKSESNTSNPKNLKAEAFTQKCLSEKAQKEKNSYKVTFIELGSVNCIPCKKMQPVMREIEKEYPDVKVLFYDV